MKKGGQFYLVAAIVVTAIVISIIAVSNYSNKNEFPDLTSLRDELNIESAKVIDYGVSHGLSQAQMNQNLIGFTQIYIDTESRDKDLYFIFGNQNNVTLKGFQNTAHSILLDGIQITSSAGAFFASIDPVANTITLSRDGSTHVFDLKSGENFFFIISRQVGGNDYVITG